MIKLNKHGMISKRLIAPEFTVGNTFVEGGGTPEELAVLSLTNEQLAALSYIVNGEGRIIPVGEDGTFDTKIGHSYCIRHTDDLTLHEAWLSNDENLYVKRYGSGQLLFFATSEKCKINNPSYIVTEVFRMAALNEFVDWSGISTTQAWFKKIEVELTELLGSKDKFVLEIADENTLVAHTDRISDDLLPVVKATTEAKLPEGIGLAQYNHHIEVSWRDINKYANCVTETDFAAVNPNYRDDVTSDGWWVYPIPKYKGYQGGGHLHIFQNNDKLIVFDAVYNSASTTYSVFSNSSNIETIILRDYKRKSDDMFNEFSSNSQKLRKVVCDLSILKTIRYISFGSSALEEIYIGGLPNLKDAQASCFAPAKLNKRSALEILNSIPNWTDGATHNLSLGIHVDNQSDDEVLTAIAGAEAKGWTMTVRWNGTPTTQVATTYELRKSLIYARVSEHELPDGTTEQYLDWGHYVTDETGYETFRSLEGAYEYFGLEMPQMNEE